MAEDIEQEVKDTKHPIAEDTAEISALTTTSALKKKKTRRTVTNRQVHVLATF